METKRTDNSNISKQVLTYIQSNNMKIKEFISKYGFSIIS